MDLFSLKGKVALVTGGTNGIGLGMLKGLVGADIEQVILTYRSDEALSNTIHILKKIKPEVKISSIRANLNDTTLENSLVTRIANEAFELTSTGKIDILINNAGINNRFPFLDLSQEKFDEVLRVNLNIPVKLTKEIGLKMLESNTKGSIVFTGSLCSFQGGVNSTAYAITKGGIKQFAAALSNEWSLKGIRVNVIAPGYITTNLSDEIEPELRETLISRIPIGRWGTLDDFQGPAVFLCSEASSYVTGETMVVDGGWLNY
ncbi:uncharacterized protein PRCAT00004241001 [Priceomyces carsonii]|uniref:uncharacterized protein n=1 Tax=Priceomyces carsonii TaxID=28549 RepID=UPI002EDB8F1D|nr:unnamed protein product [Priceomyces carsonii]